MIKPVRSLLSYQGSKFQLIEDLWQYMPDDVTDFYDVFGGSGVVTINMKPYVKRCHYNEYDSVITNILKSIRDCDSPENLEMRFDRCVEHFDLGRDNKQEFIEFVEHCNRKPHPLKWLVVSKHCFSNLLRFNDGRCTAQFGARGFLPSKSRTEKFERTWEAFQDVKMTSIEFRKYLKDLCKKLAKRKDRSKVFVYLDPPYLASGDLVYKGAWTIYDDEALFKYCKLLDELGVKWMLSNVFRHGGHVNKPLIKFAKKRKHKVIHIDANYILKKGYDQSEQGTEEVLIKNY